MSTQKARQKAKGIQMSISGAKELLNSDIYYLLFLLRRTDTQKQWWSNIPSEELDVLVNEFQQSIRSTFDSLLAGQENQVNRDKIVEILRDTPKDKLNKEAFAVDIFNRLSDEQKKKLLELKSLSEDDTYLNDLRGRQGRYVATEKEVKEKQQELQKKMIEYSISANDFNQLETKEKELFELLKNIDDSDKQNNPLVINARMQIKNLQKTIIAATKGKLDKETLIALIKEKDALDGREASLKQMKLHPDEIKFLEREGVKNVRGFNLSSENRQELQKVRADAIGRLQRNLFNEIRETHDNLIDHIDSFNKEGELYKKISEMLQEGNPATALLKPEDRKLILESINRFIDLRADLEGFIEAFKKFDNEKDTAKKLEIFNTEVLAKFDTLSKSMIDYCTFFATSNVNQVIVPEELNNIIKLSISGTTSTAIGFQDYIIKPVQSGLKYTLFAREMGGLAKEGDPFFKAYTEFGVKAKKIGDTANEAVKNAKAAAEAANKASITASLPITKNSKIKVEKGDMAVTMKYLGDANKGRHNTKEFIRNSTQFKLPNLEVHENPQGVGNRLSKKSVFIIKEKGDKGRPLFKITVDKDGVKIEGVGINNSNDPKYLQQMNEIIKQLHTNPPPKETPELQSINIKSMIAMMSQDVYRLDADSARVIRKDRERIKAESKINEHVVEIQKSNDYVKLSKQFQQAIDNGLIPTLVDLDAQPWFRNQGALGFSLRINTDDAVIAIKQYEAALAAGMVIVLGDKATDAIKKGASENAISISVPQNNTTGSEILARITKATEAGLLVSKVVPPKVMDVLKNHLITSPPSSILLRGQPDPYLAVNNLISLGIACTPNGDDVRRKIQEKQGVPAIPFPIPDTGNESRNLELLKHYLSHGISVKVPDAEKLFASLDKSQVVISLEKLPKDEQLTQVQALAVMGIDGIVTNGTVPAGMPIMVRSNNDVRAIKSFEGFLRQGFMPVFEKSTLENLANNNADLGVFVNDIEPKKLLNKIQHCFTVGVKVNSLPEQTIKMLKDYLSKNPEALPNRIIQIDGFNAAAIRENIKLCQVLGIKVNATDKAKSVLKSDPNRSQSPIEVQDVNKKINKKGSLSLDVEKTMENAKNLAATGCKVILSPGAQSYLQQLDRKQLKEEAAKRIFFFFKPQSAKEAQVKLNELKHYDSFIEVAKKEQSIATTIGNSVGESSSTPKTREGERAQATTFSARPEQPLSKQPFDKVREEIIKVFNELFDKTLDGYLTQSPSSGEKIALNKQAKEVLDEVRKKESPEEIKKYLDSVCNGTMNYNVEIKKLASEQLQKLDQSTPKVGHTMTGRHNH